MASLLDILIRARDQASGAISRVGSSVRDLGAGVQAAGAKISAVGDAMTRTVTPAAAGVALALGKIASSWNEAQRTLRLGNTQEEFEALVASARRVAGGVTQPFEAVAAALDEVADRTGLTGKPLERLTKRFLQLEHITGEAASSTIPAVVRAFADWGVRIREQQATLDALMRASEASGAGVGELATQVQQFGAPLRQLGFSLTEATAMFAAFEKGGVNTAAVMPGIRMAIKNLAAPSDELARTFKRLGIDAKDPKTALTQLFEAIKDAPNQTKATELALKVFGARAGPALASAIREGKLDFSAFVREIESGRGTIKDAARESRTLADRFAMLRNRIVGALGPFADLGSFLASGVAAVGPFLMGLGQLITVLGKVRLATIAALGVWALVAAAVVAVVVLIIKNWDKVKAFLLKAWEALKGAALKVWAAIKGAALRLWSAIKAPVQAYLGFWRGAFNTIWGVAKAVWDKIAGAARWAWDRIKGVWSAVRGWFRDLFNGIKDMAKDVWSGIVDAVKTIWNGLAGLWNRGPGSWRIGFPSWVPGLGGKGWDVPDLPLLAHGGIVTRPTVAVLGEAGPEAVIPLSRARPPLRVDVRLVVDRRRFVGATDAEYAWGGRW